MMYANGIRKEDTYTLYDVFGPGKIFYKGTTVRIAGWETPASIFYVQNEKLRIRFKKVLEPFWLSYQDAPFDGNPSYLFYDLELKDYNAKEPFRRMEYALARYKNTQADFSCAALTPEEVEERLSNEDLFVGPEYAFNHEINYSEFYDTACYFFPVDVDAFITDFAKRNAFHSDQALLVSWNGRAMLGQIGYDGNFYNSDLFSKQGEKPRVYDIHAGVKEIQTPQWLSKTNFSVGYIFLRNYIICPDNTCYAYSGEFLAAKTKHHSNVDLLNNVIRHLRKDQPKEYADKLGLQLVVPREFTEFDIKSVEAIVLPHLESKGALNKAAWERFLDVKAIIEKVGLSANFGCAFRNILELNKAKLYGGSKRNICGRELLDNLRRLNKKVGNEKMAALLENEVRLKMEVARVNKMQVVEMAVSEEAFSTIKADRKVPGELKKDPAWESLQAGTLVVFSCGTEERFCAVTTSTKAGLGLNRA